MTNNKEITMVEVFYVDDYESIGAFVVVGDIHSEAGKAVMEKKIMEIAEECFGGDEDGIEIIRENFDFTATIFSEEGIVEVPGGQTL